MTLRELDELLLDYVSGELDADTTLRIEQFVAADPRARRQLGNYRAVSQLVASRLVQPLDATAKAELDARVLRLVEASGAVEDAAELGEGLFRQTLGDSERAELEELLRPDAEKDVG